MKSNVLLERRKLLISLAVGTLSLLCVIALGSVTACEDAFPNVETPITISFSMSAVPTLNENAVVICTVSSVLDAPNTEVRIILPDG